MAALARYPLRVSGLSEELVQALRDRASRTPGIEFLDDLVIETIVAQVGERFISDCDARWWWTEVKGTTQEVLYDDAGRTYVDALRDVIRDQAESLTMVVTDDEFPPWVGIRGDLDTLLGLLKDLWAFE